MLRPRSVAIIGASADPTKRGYQIVQALQQSGYKGRIYPVNPRGGRILSLPVSPSVSDLPEATDLAVLCTPAAQVPELLESCADRGIGAAVVLALGFREAGAPGEALEGRVRDVTTRRGIRVLGPNTSGLLNLPLGLNLIGIHAVRPGRFALIVQSGNVLLELATRAAREEGEGFAVCVGLGNMVDVAWHDVLDDLNRSDQIRAVLMYSEGFEHGRAFVEAAARLSQQKPIALLHGGRSEVGSRSARSHTGALASGSLVLSAGLRAAGVVEVTRIDELYAVGTALAWQPAVTRGGIVILSDGGGHATIAADAFAGLGVQLATLSSATRSALRELLGPAAAVSNPIDVAGAADRGPGVFAAALRQLILDKSVGAFLVAGLFGGYAIRFASGLAEAETEAAIQMAEAARASGHALIVHSVYAHADSRALDALQRAEVPVIASLEVACRALAALIERGRVLQRLTVPQLPEPHRRGAGPLTAASAEGREALLETEARSLLADYGVPLVEAEFCTTPEQAARAAERIAAPVAVRLVSSTILHKTEAGGVRLNVRGPDAAAQAFHTIQNAADEWAVRRGNTAGVRGVLVAPMMPRPLVELIVGARRDPAFGPLLVLGIGGITVEAVGDIVLRLLPTTKSEIISALAALRGAALLEGLRGSHPVDVAALSDLALGIGACLLDNPELTDVEANPVFAYGDRVVAVDVRAVQSNGMVRPRRT